ncbi:MAG: hypothetical protein HY720_08580 [Planctomycetes bacterium]|nr:hypothetical protein [Planctomycetota bacterium]
MMRLLLGGLAMRWTYVLALLLLTLPTTADDLVFRTAGGRAGETELVRGKIVGEDDQGNYIIQVKFGRITKPKSLLVEVRPGIETRLEALVPERPREYLDLAALVLSKRGQVDLGEDYSIELVERLVFTAVRLDPVLHVEGHRLLAGRPGPAGREGGVENPFDAMRYAARILLVEPGDQGAMAVYLAAREEVAKRTGDIEERVPVMLRLYAEGKTAEFLRLLRPFGRPGTPQAQALAARGDAELSGFIARAISLACDSCNLKGSEECGRCRGKGQRETNCPTCKAKGSFERECPNCFGKGSLAIPGSATVRAPCRVCQGYKKVKYDCETCHGDRYLLTPCEECGQTGTIVCPRCGGDLWVGEESPGLSPDEAMKIAARYDPEGKAALSEVEGEGGEGEGGTPAADAEGLDPTPLVPMGTRELDPEFRDLAEVVFLAGEWMTPEAKKEALARDGGK